ncbi:hypothetical protein, partial [Thiolapillus sp.]|uniref:hypothetical protein n=1 Tax=Thiolapillus sp. TaxID=2017437 RepID=UPI0027397AD5
MIKSVLFFWLFFPIPIAECQEQDHTDHKCGEQCVHGNQQHRHQGAGQNGGHQSQAQAQGMAARGAHGTPQQGQLTQAGQNVVYRAHDGHWPLAA